MVTSTCACSCKCHLMVRSRACSVLQVYGPGPLCPTRRRARNFAARLLVVACLAVYDQSFEFDHESHPPRPADSMHANSHAFAHADRARSVSGPPVGGAEHSSPHAIPRAAHDITTLVPTPTQWVNLGRFTSTARQTGVGSACATTASNGHVAMGERGRWIGC